MMIPQTNAKKRLQESALVNPDPSLYDQGQAENLDYPHLDSTFHSLLRSVNLHELFLESPQLQ